MHEQLHHLLRSIRTATGSPAAGPSDAQLLERFVAGRDEAAFELLLWRHGPAVLGVCQRLLRCPHDAEDAFQATFLVLARKAGSIARREAVGSYLYRVAYRVALRMRAERRSGEPVDADTLAAPADAGPAWREFCAVLDEEVNRLPARHRDAFVLCCLEGKTGEEAARELGCPPGTVSSRLTRARERLRRRLVRRGLGPGSLGGEALAVPITVALVQPTLHAVVVFTSGGVLTSRAVAHAEGVLRAMFLTRLKVAVLCLLLVGCLAVGGLVTHRALAVAPPTKAGRETTEDKKQRPLTVRVVKPQRGGLPGKTQQLGTFEAWEREDLVAAVSGVVKGLDVDIGDRVKRGQVLAEINAPLLVLGAKQAAAALLQAKGLLRQAEARLLTAKAEVSAVKNLLVDLVRSRDVTDRASAAKARGDLEVKQGKLAEAEAAVATARANIAVAEVELEKAHYSLSLTKIVASFDGVVTRRNGSNGQYVRAGEGRKPLLTVQRIDRLRVVTNVAQRAAVLTEPGAAVDLSIGGLEDVRFPGAKVSRVGFVLEQTSGTMRVEIDVPNPKQQLRPGMVGSVVVHLKPSSTGMRLPRSCVLESKDPRFPFPYAVYVVRKGKAHRIAVGIGTQTATEVEVTGGLKADDRVVVDPKGLEGEGVAVEVKEK